MVESLYLLILICIILLIIFPISFNLYFSYNLNTNSGFFSIKIWKLNLKKYRIKRKGKEIIFIEKHKDKDLEIELNEKQIRFFELFFKEVKGKIRISNFELESEIGEENPFISAILSGIFSSIILAFFARLKSSQPTASFKFKNNANFFEAVFNMKTSLEFSISIFDIIYSLFIAILESKTDKNIKVN